MTQLELLDFLESHEYTDKEKEQSYKIIDIVREQGIDCIGYYVYPTEKLRQDGLSFSLQRPVSVVAISNTNKTNSFNYYIVEMSDNAIHVTDFQEKHTAKRWGEDTNAFQCLLYYLLEVMGDLYGYSKKNSHYVLHKGYCVKATLRDNGKYSLAPIHGYASNIANDEILQYVCRFTEPVFERIECPSCHRGFMFDDTKIPVGEKYEAECPMCKMSLIRKKVISE